MLRSGDLWRDMESFAILAMGFLTKGFGKLINCLEWTITRDGGNYPPSIMRFRSTFGFGRVMPFHISVSAYIILDKSVQYIIPYIMDIYMCRLIAMPYQLREGQHIFYPRGFPINLPNLTNTVATFAVGRFMICGYGWLSVCLSTYLSINLSICLFLSTG